MANPAIFNSPHPATGAQAPTAMGNATVYTKAQVDQIVSNIVIGLEHGLAVQSIASNPPAAPVVDEIYIVSNTPTGAWVGNSNSLATWDGTNWIYETPQAKEAHLVEDQQSTYTWNGTSWVKVAVASGSAASGDLYQVGSIQQSLLTETQWATALGAEATKWVLCDGRNVAGSRYATITGSATVPDLRGAFIRGAGQNSNAAANWNGGAVGSTHQDTTRMPRTAFTGATDSQGTHRHGMTGNFSSHNGWAYGQSASGVTNPLDLAPGDKMWTGDAGAHTHNVTISGGDAETAPVHVSLHAFIKIN